MRKSILGGLALVVTLLTGTVGTSFAQTTPTTPPSTGTPSSTSTSTSSAQGGGDLVASASQSPDHSTLVSALQAAGLADRAKGAGPFTVFAPENSAFEKLPSGTLDQLLQPTNKQKLQAIIAGHVVQGNVMSTDLKDGQKIKTVTGETLTVRMQGSSVQIVDGKGNAATVTKPDLKASNGVVHSIDAVLMPGKGM
jgi:uncharacterized surface protein with fasciclin (FAS1) repeats